MEKAKESVVDGMVFVLVVPEEVGPFAVDLGGDVVGLVVTSFFELTFEFSFEILEFGEGFATGVHFNVELVGEAHILDWEKIKGDAIRSEFAPEVVDVAEFGVDGV